MATFISLVSFTQHGEEDVRHSVERADAFKQAAKKHGAKVKDQYWTIGRHDGVLIFEAPDDETATALLLSLGSQGAVRTQTLRAFNRAEMQAIIEKLG